MPDGLLAGSIYMIVGSEMHLEEKVDTLHINVPTLNKQLLTSFGLEKQPQRLGAYTNTMTTQKGTTCMSHLSPNVWCRTGVVEGALRTGEGCEKGTLLGHRWGGEEGVEVRTARVAMLITTSTTCDP
jgi:hypothetical protein